MIILKCLKYIIYYFVLKIIYRFIKNYSYANIDRNINIETMYDTDYNNYNNRDNISDNGDDHNMNNVNQCTTLVLYTPPFNYERRKKYNLKDIYNNFFNGIREDLKNDINPAYLKTEFKKKDVSTILLKDSKKNLIVNELKWIIKTNADYLYKIKVYLKLDNENFILNPIKYIIMSISDLDGNAFIYDYILDNINNDTCENINNFSFILDNNLFGNNEITIKLNFDNINNTNISYKIEESMIEVIEKKIVDETPILIFDVNEKYTPIYFSDKNILDIEEYDSDDFE